MSEINVISEGDGAFAVVFIHGLGGHPVKTWQLNENANSWFDLLIKDRPNLGIYSIGYEAPVNDWGNAMCLLERATNLLEQIQLCYTLKKTNFLIISHSLGGLLTKQMVRYSSDRSDKYGWFVKQLQGVVFLGTPHTGSNFATLGVYLNNMLGTSELVADLKNNSPTLRDLNDWYRTKHSLLKLRTHVIYEKLPLKVGWFKTILVVSEASSDPGIQDVHPIPVDKDHLNLVKPTREDDVVYKSVLDFLDSCRMIPANVAHMPQQAAGLPYRFNGDSAEVLLVRTTGHRWTIPKGGVEKGETASQAALRETYEEAGVHGIIDKEPVTTYIHLKQEFKKKSLDERAVTLYMIKFEAHDHAGEPNRNPTWFNLETARNMLMEDRSPKYANEMARVIDLVKLRLSI